MPIFLLTISKVLGIFRLAPSAATPCASSACSSISTISFQDIPSKFGVYLCDLSEQSHVARSFSTTGSKSSSSFFALPLLFPVADGDDPLLLLALRPGERPPDRPGPPHPASPAPYHCSPANPAIPLRARPDCPNPPPAAEICAARSCTSGNICPLR